MCIHVFMCLTTLSRSSNRLLVTIRKPWISVSKPTSSSHGWRQTSDDTLLTFAPPTPADEPQHMSCATFHTCEENKVNRLYWNALCLCLHMCGTCAHSWCIEEYQKQGETSLRTHSCSHINHICSHHEIKHLYCSTTAPYKQDCCWRDRRRRRRRW